MPSTFFGLNIAASGLTAFQASINTVANNISNVQTEGYSKQTTVLEATAPLRVYASYGSTGTGVAATEITQERNLYYDQKYWENNSSLGYYDQMLYYLDQVQTLFADDGETTGFTTLLSKMFNGLDTLKTDAADESVRTQFINQAQNLCTYFNALSQSLLEIQEDCNVEIKTEVDQINSIAEQISELNYQINMIEVRGGTANELRDQRAVLIDQLSQIVSVETQEFDVHNSNGEDLGGTNYRVFINGQVLVDGNDYRTLECVASDYKNNDTDADGMYSIIWSDTGMAFAATTGTAGGSLKALFALRDGTNAENLSGTVTDAEYETVDGTNYITSFTIENLSITDVNKLNLPDSGTLTIGSKTYTYESWTAELGEDGLVSFTFNLTPETYTGTGETRVGSTLTCGTSVNTMGIPYYQAQINEFLRNFAEAFNNLEYGGETLDSESMGSFFAAMTLTGNEYEFDDYYAYMEELENGAETVTIGSTTSDADYTNIYNLLTATTVEVNQRSIRDPRYFATTESIVDGVDAYDIVEQLLTLQSGVKMFRGDTAEKFLETLLSDVTVDVNKVEIYSNNYSNMEGTISNLRQSVSGVDEDEEALDLVKFQNAYNLASKMVSVMNELYDKLINETGVT
ncbi:MAG: flagellar hook-associated protein FlgK [Clostridiales bacterium]|nr:flagellar hook-associated protein FlgK [Clostridiales bacterium]